MCRHLCPHLVGQVHNIGDRVAGDRLSPGASCFEDARRGPSCGIKSDAPKIDGKQLVVAYVMILRRRAKRPRVTAPQREEAAHVLVPCRLVSCLITSLKLFMGREASAWVHRAYRQPGSAPTTESVVCNHLWHLFLFWRWRCDRYRGALREGYLTVVSAAPSTPGEREIRSRSWGPAPVLFIEERRIERKRHIHAT